MDQIRDPETNVSDDDELTTGKIARAHLNELPDYYTRLAKMEAEAEHYWSDQGADRIARRGGTAMADQRTRVPSAGQVRACVRRCTAALAAGGLGLDHP